ncbi:MAG: hypothetical protein L3J22_11115 [Xanthomonadales bacterium]|nr:hypothetical protein [Xanthomonadales bacterium]
MHRTRHISKGFHMFIAVACLFLLSATAFAGGVGDLLPDDSVDKTKPIPTETKAPPIVAADAAIVKEAEEVKAWCQKNPRVKTNHDCECVANRFIAERQADPVVGKDELLSRIITANKCPSLEGIRANGYKECMGSSGIPGFNTNGNELETYCQCVGKRTSKNISEHKGKLGPKQRSNYNYYAYRYCSKAEAYK